MPLNGSPYVWTEGYRLLSRTDLAISWLWPRHVDSRGFGRRAGTSRMTGMVSDRGQPRDQRRVWGNLQSAATRDQSPWHALRHQVMRAAYVCVCVCVLTLSWPTQYHMSWSMKANQRLHISCACVRALPFRAILETCHSDLQPVTVTLCYISSPLYSTWSFFQFQKTIPIQKGRGQRKRAGKGQRREKRAAHPAINLTTASPTSGNE